jgi:hypothetical protein
VRIEHWHRHHLSFDVTIHILQLECIITISWIDKRASAWNSMVEDLNQIHTHPGRISCIESCRASASMSKILIVFAYRKSSKLNHHHFEVVHEYWHHLTFRVTVHCISCKWSAISTKLSINNELLLKVDGWGIEFHPRQIQLLHDGATSWSYLHYGYGESRVGRMADSGVRTLI